MTRVQSDAYISPDIRIDGDNVEIKLFIGTDAKEWGAFGEYCRRFGHGEPELALIYFVRRALIERTMDTQLDEHKTRARLSAAYMPAYKPLANYLVIAHLLVLVSGYLIELILRTGSIVYVITTYMYVISLCLALAAWGGRFIRELHNPKEWDEVSSTSKDAIILTAKISERLWFTSVFMLLGTVVIRLLHLIISLPT